MYNSSERHNLQKFKCILDNTFVTMLHSITGDRWASPNTEIAMSCQSMYGNSKMLIYQQLRLGIGRLKVLSYVQCIVNVPLWNDYSKLTHS